MFSLSVAEHRACVRACVPRCRLLCNIAAAAAAWLPTTVSVIDNKTDAAAEQWTLYQQASHMARRALNRQFMVCDVVYLRWTSSISGLLTDIWRRLQTRLINISSVLHHGGPPSHVLWSELYVDCVHYEQQGQCLQHGRSQGSWGSWDPQFSSHNFFIMEEVVYSTVL